MAKAWRGVRQAGRAPDEQSGHRLPCNSLQQDQSLVAGSIRMISGTMAIMERNYLSVIALTLLY